MRKLHPAVFPHTFSEPCHQFQGVYRMRRESCLDVQGAASTGPVCAFIALLMLELKVISEYMRSRGFPQRPQVRCLAAFLLAEANLLL